MKIGLEGLCAALLVVSIASAAEEKKAGPSPAPPPTERTQAEKMKACHKEAAGKSLKGDDRKKFMSECLKASKK
jgi:hypothetical protein